MNNDTVWAVMVPMQEDGGGEWIMPEIPFWTMDSIDGKGEDKARKWAQNWCQTHIGDAIVFECKEVWKYHKIQDAKIIEGNFIPRSSNG